MSSTLTIQRLPAVSDHHRRWRWSYWASHKDAQMAGVLGQQDLGCRKQLFATTRTEACRPQFVFAIAKEVRTYFKQRLE